MSCDGDRRGQVWGKDGKGRGAVDVVRNVYGRGGGAMVSRDGDG